MKKAFSLIELVVTIVVVAIVSLAVPNVIKQISTSNARSLTQESILNAKTYLGLIMQSYYTCEAVSTAIANGTNSTVIAPRFFKTDAYTTDNKTFYELVDIGSSRKRSMYPTNDKSLLSTKCGNNATVTTKSLDDFDDTSTTIDMGLERDYIVNSLYSIKVKTDSVGSGSNEIKLNDIFPIPAPDNFDDMKMISVEALSYGSNTDIKTNVRLIGFAANLGDSPILKGKKWQ